MSNRGEKTHIAFFRVVCVFLIEIKIQKKYSQIQNKILL